MSASEKLRKAMEDEEVFIVVGSLDPPPLHEAGTHSPHAAVTIRNALPQIVAVVEAAEGWYEIGEDAYVRLPKFAQAHYGPIHEDETPTHDRCFRLTALSALEGALGGDVT